MAEIADLRTRDNFRENESTKQRGEVALFCHMIGPFLQWIVGFNEFKFWSCLKLSKRCYRKLDKNKTWSSVSNSNLSKTLNFRKPQVQKLCCLPPKTVFIDAPFGSKIFLTEMKFNENDLWRDKTELRILRLSKLPSTKVLLKL